MHARRGGLKGSCDPNRRRACHPKRRAGNPRLTMRLIRFLIPHMLTAKRISELLLPFGLSLSLKQEDVLIAYLDLLLRWNQKINLTSVTKPADCVQRHFGESFYLSKVLEPSGKLLDIGSGAGFPGLAIKILYPELCVTLLEPIAKKRAFLKEAARVCEMKGVEVSSDHLEDFAKGSAVGSYDIATARAVGNLQDLAPLAARCLKHGGSLGLWLGLDQVEIAQASNTNLKWSEPEPIPLSSQRVIMAGRLN